MANLAGCPTIAFCYDRLQTPSPALERPKHPQRSINYVSGDFALSALSTKFSLDLAPNTILGQPPGHPHRRVALNQFTFLFNRFNRRISSSFSRRYEPLPFILTSKSRFSNARMVYSLALPKSTIRCSYTLASSS